LKEIKILI